jgi:hypothetical protein
MILLSEGDISVGVDVPLLRNKYGSILVDSFHLGECGKTIGVFEVSGCDGHLETTS